jgi:outer membrane protein OmpA-like peptidoglycan-associated protein
MNVVLNPPPAAAPRDTEAPADRAKQVGLKTLPVRWSHLSFWLIALLLCLLLNYAVTTGIRGFGKRPLEVNGLLLCLAAGISVVSWIVALWYVFGRVKESSILLNGWVRGALSAFGILAPICLVIAALRPAPLPPDQDYIFVAPPQPVEHKLGTAFLFPNGRNTFFSSEVSRLADEIQMLRRCDGTKMELRGYASSAQYKTDNEARNLKLANDRADALSNQLAEKGIHVTPHHWPTFFAMSTDRRIRDVDASRKRIKAKERLNRRVELWWSEENDCMEQATK